MRIRVLAVGDRMPAWVEETCDDYLRRLPRDFQLAVQTVKAAPRKRGTRGIDAALREAENLLSRIDSTERVIVLDVSGQLWSTEDLVSRVQSWRMDGRDVCLIIGGPDGLHADCLSRAELRWSLSRLTLPHPLVRVILVEQLFRVWSIISNHPYHR